MRLTADISDSLFREIKIRAIHDGKTVKDIVETALKSFLHSGSVKRSTGKRVKFPFIKGKRAEKLKALRVNIVHLLDELEDAERYKNL